MLDTLEEYGNAAEGDAESFAGNARGFTATGAGESAVYSITAGGTDFWSGTDHGSMLHANGVTVDGNFSAVVRSVSVAASFDEGLAGEWGRTGLMARTDPTAANSPNVAHIRKTGGSNNGTVLQYRDTFGGGTSRDSEDHGNGFENNWNFDVRDSPIFMALHRYDGVYYTTWATDTNLDGIPDEWSEPQSRASNGDTEGAMTIGLVHQSHNIHPEVNTAVFDNFSVGDFDNSLGQFPSTPTVDIVESGTQLRLTASQMLLGGGGVPEDVNWKVELMGPSVASQGVKADIYFRNNSGNLASTLDAFANNDPDGTAIIQGLRWGRGENYPQEFVDATGQFQGAGDSVDNFTVDHTGEMFIPANGSLKGPIPKTVQFKDGVDDFTYLEIDGVELINDNAWTGQSGADNNGSPIVEFDVSDAKYDDGEWVPFRFITAEGGGGDGGFLYWDAADDGFFPVVQTDPADFNHWIPDANFRTLQPSVVREQSGSGQPNNQLLTIALTPEVTGYRVLVDGVVVLARGLDNDQDGIPNQVEVDNGLDPESAADAALDKDGDGLTNLEDYELGTEISNPDVDDDGLKDGDEINVHQTNPFEADSDSDGLDDGAEIALGTNPLDEDTDKDGFKDGSDPNPLVFDQDKIEIGLVGYWPLDESENGVHPDAAGGDHNGEDDPAQFDPIPHTPGKFGNGVLLDGFDQNIIISGDENDFDFAGGSMTVSAWFRADAFGANWQALVAKGEGGGWRMHRRGGDQAMAFTGGAAGDIQAADNVGGETSDVFLDDIYHIVGVSEAGSTQRMYINGVLVGEKVQQPLENRQNAMRIGENPDALGRWWAGMIDDVAVWGRALSDLQIARIWNNGEGASIQSLIDEDGGGGPQPSAPFLISSVAHDAATGSVTIDFPSDADAEYAIEVSTTLGAETWSEASDATGGAGASTQVTLSAADIINALGAAPAGAVYVRVVKR